MRQELDEERDVMVTIWNDNPIVNSQEHDVRGYKHVLQFDADGVVVRSEVHGYSKAMEAAMEKAKATTRTKYSADQNATEIVADLEWEVSECKTGKIISAGQSSPRLADVTVRLSSSPNESQVSVGFSISEHVQVALVSSLFPTNRVSGFALQAMRTDLATFCWEWFNVDEPNHAVKLQETGELRFDVAQCGESWQVIRTDFLTDVSLRLIRFGESNPLDPEWRVLVRKGSFVNWPCLVDGQVFAPSP